MLAPPGGVNDSEIVDALGVHWGIRVSELAHDPVGFGSYHWQAREEGGLRWFVTVDDLLGKSWLGDEPVAVLDGLDRAYGTAAALSHECHCEFVLAPTTASDGRAVHHLKDHWAISVTPYLHGHAGSFGDSFEPTTSAALARALAALHAAGPTTVIPRQDDAEASRQPVVSLLGSLDDVWEGGPWSEPARNWCREHALDIQRLLDEHDALEERCASRADVITHGEPHAGNVLILPSSDGTDEARLLLIDWDTVAVARPERDVWLAAGGSTGTLDPAFLREYARASDRVLDPTALEVARLRWMLSDVATLAEDLKSPHERNADADATWRYLTGLDLAPAREQM